MLSRVHLTQPISNRKRSRLAVFLSVAVVAALHMSFLPASGADEVFGPTNLLKTMATPFGAPRASGDESTAGLEKFTLQTGGRSLMNRLLPPRLYLPGRMVIGSTAEFIVKGRPGAWVALAMADKDSGAKPIYGHQIKLGPDRKVVSINQIPEGGVVSLVIDTPIQGDLIGQYWFFEAAVWSKPDFSDIEIATPVASEAQPGLAGHERLNGVLVAAEPTKKKWVRFAPEGAVPLQQVRGSTSLDAGRP
jgi:hypothetical protein